MNRLIITLIALLLSLPAFSQISTTSGKYEGYRQQGGKYPPVRAGISTTSQKYEGYSTGGRRTAHNYRKSTPSIVSGGDASEVYLPEKAVYVKGGPSWSWDYTNINVELGFQKFFNGGKSPAYYGQTVGLKNMGGVIDKMDEPKVNNQAIYYEPVRFGWCFGRQASHNNFSFDLSIGYWAAFNYAIKVKDPAEIDEDEIKDMVNRFSAGISLQGGLWFSNFYLGYTVHANNTKLAHDADDIFTQMWTIGLRF